MLGRVSQVNKLAVFMEKPIGELFEFTAFRHR